MTRSWLKSVALHDVLVPQLGPIADEAGHQGDAIGIVGDQHLDAARAQELRVAWKIPRLAHHHAGNAELDDGAGAHHAGRERGIKRHAAIGSLTPGFAQTVHLAVRDGIALLNALVAPPRDEALPLRQHAADGAATFMKAR